jgi:hypothetical protein
MNTWVEPPPEKGMGCFGKGCLILVVFLVLLVIACFAGIYWGMHTQSALARGLFWLTKIHAVADTPGLVPEFKASGAEMGAAKERWQKFEETVRDGQPGEIALTAADLNNLIAANRHLAGTIFASIEGNRVRLQVSAPLAQVTGRAGYYFNADIFMQTDGPESLDHPPLTRITVNNEAVPADLLDWKYRSRRFRDYLSEYTEGYRTGSIEIRDGKLILRSRAN